MAIPHSLTGTRHTLTGARSRLGQLVNLARFGRERVILTEHGQPVAAIISVQELSELQALADAADLRAVADVKARNEPSVPHLQVMAALDALDAADAAENPAAAATILAPHSDVLVLADGVEAPTIQ